MEVGVFIGCHLQKDLFSNDMGRGHLPWRRNIFNNCLCIVLTIVNIAEIFNPALSSNLCDLRVHLTSNQYCTANQ